MDSGQGPGTSQNWRDGPGPNKGNWPNKQHDARQSSKWRRKEEYLPKINRHPFNKSTDKSNKGRYHSAYVGFITLRNLSQSDSKEILSELNKKREAFMEILQKPIERLDLYWLILQIAAKVCDSSFDQLKSQLLLDICNSNFTKNLNMYLMELPYMEEKKNNSMYWDNEIKLWENLLILLESITMISPSTSLIKCRTLIEGASKCCIDGLKERHDFELPEELNIRFHKLRNLIADREKMVEKKEIKSKSHEFVDEGIQPPTSFRELSILPTTEDLLEEKPFLRPNIIEGAYSDVEHYLDVQFRLLREDCFGPIRQGILQYLQDSTKRKYDNIRLFRNVTFAEPYVSSVNFGQIIQLDARTTNGFKKIKWAYNKRFLFGALVLLTKDNCKSFIVATVLDRDASYLCKGKIPISIMSDMATLGNYDKDIYLMIESDVYFEPYYHVLKVLQDPTFPEDISMKKYIVNVEPSSTIPEYFKDRDLESILSSADGMSLNESQFEAFKLALTHEFAVIQGPPGTGKTYVGVKIAETLLTKLKKTGCKLLIICYTNHALDQFLENILSITNSIVRIGGQSRLKALTDFNLNNLRTNKTNFTSLYFDKKNVLKEKVSKLKQLQQNISSLDSGIVNFEVINKTVIASKFACNRIFNCYYVDDKSKTELFLYNWLFHGVQYDINRPIASTIDSLTDELNNVEKNNDDRYLRLYDRESDDLFNIDRTTDSNICVFTMVNSKRKLLKLLELCNKADANQIYEMRKEIIMLETNIEIFNTMKSRWDQDENKGDKIRFADPLKMPFYNRWMLYFQWVEVLKKNMLTNVRPLQEQTLLANTQYEEARMLLDLSLIKDRSVVGMTTSGAARLRKFIKELAPSTIIVEEAAEVLEQHIVTSLQKECQHLILIGDHQQLRPSAAHMQLAKNYNIEVSLFERMINNNMHSRRLSVQHRMRPEIAALISPHIYPELQNHFSVETFPNVRGISKNLFFLTHDHPEEIASDTTSKMNSYEANLALGLANYIMQQGYDAEDVTILSAYTAQMFYMKREKNNYIHLKDVKVTVVDNYQGEESKIIILSLVRNNNEKKIGFLGTVNRICVALSRAREGFYIFGNVNMLKEQSELWRNISETLEEQKSVGMSLPLKCEKHPEQITKIVTAQDFNKVPEGGCLLKCNSNLPCSHCCPLICHSYDSNHEFVTCIEKCERLLECDQHVCPLKCAIPCKPCVVEINKHLPCGHNKDVPCHVEPKDVKCMEIIIVTLPCSHEAQKACYVNMKNVACPEPCKARLSCGHVCAHTCHIQNDPEHERVACEKPCTKLKKGCTFASEENNHDHLCPKKCYETCDECKVEVVKKRNNCKHTMRVACNVDINAINCLKNCARLLECNHHCKKKCYEPCGGCLQLVDKKVPGCGHTIRIQCSMEPTPNMCRAQCKRSLPCGHPCPKNCGEPCDDSTCNLPSDIKLKAPCGHEVTLTCKISQDMDKDCFTEKTLLKICQYPCGAILGCEHPCTGTCSTCWQGRLHEPCAYKCDKDIICGHRCVEACNEICPPCNKPCEVSCLHSKCNNKCGSPCKPCMEKCTRQCQHGSCTRLCGEPCSVPPCSEPCPKIQTCGHPCHGLCGHPCPDVCKQCNPEEFPKDFLNEDYKDDDKLVLLEDCKHLMEVEELDTWMFSKMETIGMKTCPLCRKPIVRSYRYKDLINKMLKDDINPIKEKFYGKEDEIKKKQEEFTCKFDTFKTILREVKNRDQYIALKYCSRALKCLHNYVINNKRPSLMQVEMNFIYLDILEMLAEKHHQSIKLVTTTIKKEITVLISILCLHLIKNVKKINHRQQQEIQNELNRLHSMVQFAKLLDHPAYDSVKNNSNVKNAYEEAEKFILGFDTFNLDKAMKLLNIFQKEIQLNNVISTKQQRDMIVKAIGLKAGHWFKCPNGHFYCIGECGGAMETSKCPDCGEKIGGSQHRLLENNTHSKEMDGSDYPAWSEQYNNLANFQLD